MDLRTPRFTLVSDGKPFLRLAHRLERTRCRSELVAAHGVNSLLPKDGDASSISRSSKCPRQELNLVLDLRRVVCESGTPQGRTVSIHQCLAEESNLVLQFRTLPCSSGTPARRIASQVSRPGFEPGPGPSEGPMQIRYTIGIQITQEPTTGFAPASTCLQDRRLSVSSHVGKHEREESNPVRQLWRLTALPGAHSCKAHGPYAHRAQGPVGDSITTSPAGRSSTSR